VSVRLGGEFVRHYGVLPGRLRVIPNGVGGMAAAGARERLRGSRGIPDRRPVLLTIGRPDFVKGASLLSRAWKSSRAAARGAVWVTAGGEAPVRRPGRIVTGPVPHSEVLDWIAAADLGAFPSFYEGCGLALLEMLAGGLYTLSHDVGVAPEAIRPGTNGEIVPRDPVAWGAALERFLDRPPPRG